MGLRSSCYFSVGLLLLGCAINVCILCCSAESTDQNSAAVQEENLTHGASTADEQTQGENQVKNITKAEKRKQLRGTKLFKDSKKLWKKFKHFNLPRRDPVEIGHRQDVVVEESGVTLTLKTVALKPPVFEIDNFLSEDEVQHLVSEAQEDGFTMSQTYGDAVPDRGMCLVCDAECRNFTLLDTDGDGKLSATEGATAFSQGLDLFATEAAFHSVIRDSWWDFDGDGQLSRYEFYHVNGTRLNNTLSHLKEVAPQYKARHSHQTWIELNADDVMIGIQKKVMAVTGLPREIINASEALQVVHYTTQGHYHCHMDSDDSEYGACCHNRDPETMEEQFSCRACRYLTLLYFLNDVEKGGETAFPVADNETVNDEVLHGGSEQLCNLEKSCHKAGLVVKPKKGKAIMWYNHFLNTTSNWTGAADLFSHHGGCHVIRGEKWIANNWINLSPFRMKDTVAMAKALVKPRWNHTESVPPDNADEPTVDRALPSPAIDEALKSDALK